MTFVLFFDIFHISRYFIIFLCLSWHFLIFLNVYWHSLYLFAFCVFLSSSLYFLVSLCISWYFMYFLVFLGIHIRFTSRGLFSSLGYGFHLRGFTFFFSLYSYCVFVLILNGFQWFYCRSRRKSAEVYLCLAAVGRTS